jgi:hypothetical protein
MEKYSSSHLFRLILLCLTPAVTYSADSARPPTIHIVRAIQDPGCPHSLKMLYEECASAKQNLLAMRASDTQGFWQQTYAAIRRSWPRYNVDAPLAGPPDSKRLCAARDEEYFDGEKYAIYNYRGDFKLVEDGTCSFKLEPSDTATLFDGKYRYDLNLSTREGSRMLLPVAPDLANRRNLPAPLQNPQTARTVLDAVYGGDAERAASILRSATVGRDVIAGAPCDYVTTTLTGDTRICYWSKMRVYPSKEQRSVVLKQEIPLGDAKIVEEAVRFEVGKTLPPHAFTPAPGMRTVE